MDVTPPPRDSFFLSPITPEGIETEISNLKIGKAVGPSSIPVSILEILKGALLEPLQMIFKASLLTGIVPESFKLARVVPVFNQRALMSQLIHGLGHEMTQVFLVYYSV